MANTVTFSVGGTGGGLGIKSIHNVSFTLNGDKFRYIDDAGALLGLTISLENTINPDKSIVIVPPTVQGYGNIPGVMPDNRQWLYHTALHDIGSDSITLVCFAASENAHGRDPVDEIRWTDYSVNTIQIIEFE